MGNLSAIDSWVCFYGSEFPSKALKPYDLYIFQAYGHPDIETLKKGGGKIVGYISAGEINKTSPFFSEIESAGIIVEENKDWPGAFRVDLRSEKWQELLLARVIPDLLVQGFDGIFIDTIDTAIYLENEKGKAGSVGRAKALIKEIRKRFPNISIVLNNGLFLLNDVGNSIDALVVEDVFTLYNFSKKRYLIAPVKFTAERVATLKEFQLKFGKPVLSLDYWKPSDKKRAEAIATKAIAQGFVPYIADINLETIFYHP